MDENIRLVKFEFHRDTDSIPDKIRLGNQFVDDFIFDDHESANIPINALRVIFNIIAIIGSNQFRPEDRPKQLKLFEENFETENNTFAAIKIKNSKVSPSGSTKQVIDAYEYLTKFKMSWHKSENIYGKEIKTYGGLITAPSYDQRGYTTFLISGYWLKKLIVIPEYNYLLYNLVYNIRNNKHIIFAVWLSKIPLNGTHVKLSSLNSRFGLKYKNANDFCFKFLKPVKKNLDRFNAFSFIFHYKSDLIYIKPQTPPVNIDQTAFFKEEYVPDCTRRLRYFMIRFGLSVDEMVHLNHQYRNFPQSRDLIEKSYKSFIKINRASGTKSTDYQGKEFLENIQQLIIQLYRDTRVGKLLPNGYPIII